MGEMKRANTYEEERRLKDRFASTLAICAPRLPLYAWRATKISADHHHVSVL
jgi:hypothetical protein